MVRVYVLGLMETPFKVTVTVVEPPAVKAEVFTVALFVLGSAVTSLPVMAMVMPELAVVFSVTRLTSQGMGKG